MVGGDKCCCFSVSEKRTIIVWLRISCHHDTAILHLQGKTKKTVKKNKTIVKKDFSSSDIPFFEIVGVIDGIIQFTVNICHG